MYCRHCGVELALDSAFCSKCGKSQENSLELTTQREEIVKLTKKKKFVITILILFLVLFYIGVFMNICYGEHLDKSATGKEYFQTMIASAVWFWYVWKLRNKREWIGVIIGIVISIIMIFIFNIIRVSING